MRWKGVQKAVGDGAGITHARMIGANLNPIRLDVEQRRSSYALARDMWQRVRDVFARFLPMGVVDPTWCP